LTPSEGAKYIVIIFTSPKREVVAVHRGAEGHSERRFADRRELNRGFGDALAQAFEFAAVPVLFTALGWWLDDRLGTAPALTVALAAVGFIGVCLRTIYHYKAKVERDEEGKPWTRRPR
jgi:F0F1-type ATP synthase assembly protein I